jgi:hypothetical protein
MDKGDVPQATGKMLCYQPADDQGCFPWIIGSCRRRQSQNLCTVDEKFSLLLSKPCAYLRKYNLYGESSFLGVTTGMRCPECSSKDQPCVVSDRCVPHSKASVHYRGYLRSPPPRSRVRSHGGTILPANASPDGEHALYFHPGRPGRHHGDLLGYCTATTGEKRGCG